MSDPPTDELRLRVAEGQMRRALGLREDASSAAKSTPLAAPGTPHPYRRRFVRDGEVPVTLIHHDHDDGSGVNKVAAARQALQEQVAARERAEHLLQEARATIQTLETKLAHERIGKDEALRRLEDELRRSAPPGNGLRNGLERFSKGARSLSRLTSRDTAG